MGELALASVLHMPSGYVELTWVPSASCETESGRDLRWYTSHTRSIFFIKARKGIDTNHGFSPRSTYSPSRNISESYLAKSNLPLKGIIVNKPTLHTHNKCHFWRPASDWLSNKLYVGLIIFPVPRLMWNSLSQSQQSSNLCSPYLLEKTGKAIAMMLWLTLMLLSLMLQWGGKHKQKWY